uniref:Uncharacterized protein n=1 Tax=Amphimedon queenslandica TaxID=400682 RepID=A0A1X7SRB4_AMPQE
QVLVVIFPEDEQNVIHRYQYSIKSQPCMHNPNGEWGSFMSPPLTDVNRELHSPRHLPRPSLFLNSHLYIKMSSESSDNNVKQERMIEYIQNQEDEKRHLLEKGVTLNQKAAGTFEKRRYIIKRKRWYQKCCIVL